MGNHLSISTDEIATNQPVIKELYKPLMSVDIHQTLSVRNCASNVFIFVGKQKRRRVRRNRRRS